MVTFSEIDTEITSRISPYTYNNNNNNNDDTRGDRPLQGLNSSTMELAPRTKKPCTSKPKDVTFYTPDIIPDGLRALTNGSDGLKFRKDSNIVPAAKVIVSTRKKQKQQQQHTDDSTRLKRLKKTSQDQDQEIERCRHMFQMLDTREIGEVATTAQFLKSGINKKGWIVPQTKALALPHRPHQQGIQKKCNFCKSKLQIKRFKKSLSLQEASSMSIGHGEYRMKVQSKVQELEVRLVKTQEQNEWFRARNEWLEERLRQVEIQQAEQRLMIQELVEEKRFMNEEGCPCSSSTSTSASFLASPLSAARRSNSPHHHHLLHRMTHQQTA